MGSKNSELKTNNKKKGVLEKSKKIKKSKKKILEEKKSLNQAFDKNKDIDTKSANFPNGNTSAGEVDKGKKQKKSEQNIKRVNEGSSTGPSVDKIEKKAKKLAKKLKKQAMRSKKMEEASKDLIKNKEEVADASKSKQKNKKANKKEPREPRERDPIKEAATIFVGNLPVNTKRVQLLRLFEDYAPVNGIRFRTANGKVLFKHKHRKEAGTLNAWVVLKDAETATRALNLNGTVFKNNHLRITRGALNSDHMDVKRTIFVGNLKYSANEEKLREIFSSCGDIDYVRCLRSEKGCKGVGYVCFKAPEAVGLALELNETILDERPIHVERYYVKKLNEKRPCDTSGDTTKKPTGEKRQKNKIKAIDNSSKKLSTGDSKKPKYRGFKADGVKKQKKKVTNQMQKLANKIAPKEKN